MVVTFTRDEVGAPPVPGSMLVSRDTFAKLQSLTKLILRSETSSYHLHIVFEPGALTPLSQLKHLGFSNTVCWGGPAGRRGGRDSKSAGHGMQSRVPGDGEFAKTLSAVPCLEIVKLVKDRYSGWVPAARPSAWIQDVDRRKLIGRGLSIAHTWVSVPILPTH